MKEDKLAWLTSTGTIKPFTHSPGHVLVGQLFQGILLFIRKWGECLTYKAGLLWRWRERMFSANIYWMPLISRCLCILVLECKVKRALGSITTNKAGGGDGFPVELFQILKDDAVKVLHCICLLLLLSCFSHVWLCVTPQTAAYKALPSLGFSRQEYWSWVPFPSPMHESEKWKGSPSVVSDS